MATLKPRLINNQVISLTILPRVTEIETKDKIIRTYPTLINVLIPGIGTIPLERLIGCFIAKQ
jgi:hypothetical protein